MVNLVSEGAKETRRAMDDTVADEELDDRLVAGLDAVVPRLSRELRYALDRAEGENRLTMAQLRCLQAMAATGDDAAFTTKLAQQLRVAVPTMTNMIDGLVERGLVKRQPHPTNRRQTQLLLTRAGRDLLRRYEGVVDHRLHELVAYLGPAQKERLLTALSDLAAMLEADANRTAESE